MADETTTARSRDGEPENQQPPDPGTKSPTIFDVQPPQEPDPGTKSPAQYPVQG
jgi:hypothetical protein